MADATPQTEHDPAAMSEGDMAELVADLLAGRKGDPGQYCAEHAWTITGLDLGEIEISTRDHGFWRLFVERED